MGVSPSAKKCLKTFPFWGIFTSLKCHSWESPQARIRSFTNLLLLGTSFSLSAASSETLRLRGTVRSPRLRPAPALTPPLFSSPFISMEGQPRPPPQAETSRRSPASDSRARGGIACMPASVAQPPLVCTGP